MRLKICDSHLTCKVANKCLNVHEQVEVVELNKRWSPPFPCCPVIRQCLWKKTLIKKKMCFLFGPMDKRNLIHFMKNLIDVTLILNLHKSLVKRVFHFLVLHWAYLTGIFPLIYTSNPQIDTIFYITHRFILIILNAPLFTVRPWVLVGYALRNLTFLNNLRVWNLGLK